MVGLGWGLQSLVFCVAVDLTSFSSLSLAGEDFNSTIADVIFVPGGPNIFWIIIIIFDDAIPENCAESFGVLISSGDERVNEANNMAIIQIDDDDGRCTVTG